MPAAGGSLDFLYCAFDPLDHCASYRLARNTAPAWQPIESLVRRQFELAFKRFLQGGIPDQLLKLAREARQNSLIRISRYLPAGTCNWTPG
jgi:hypothetical protein